MEALICDICGGKLVMQSGGVTRCESCGMEYTKERVQEKVQEIKGTVKIEGSVEIVKGDAEKERLLSLALECRKKKQYDDAIKICNDIIKNYPNDWRGYWEKIQSSAIIYDSAIAGIEEYSWGENYRELYLQYEYDKAIAYAPEETKANIISDRDNRYRIIKEQIRLSEKNAEMLNEIATDYYKRKFVEKLTGLSFSFGEKAEKYLGRFCKYQDENGSITKKVFIDSSDFENGIKKEIEQYNSYIDIHKCPLCLEHQELNILGRCKIHGKVKKI